MCCYQVGAREGGLVGVDTLVPVTLGLVEPARRIQLCLYLFG